MKRPHPLSSPAACFFAGAAGYPLLELAWRRRTHPSMALAGGVSLSLLHEMNHALADKPLLLRCGAGALAITSVELAAGMVFNKRHQVWDYRKCPMNFKGQICAEYTALWFLLCLGVLPCLERLDC